jgi:glycosyltransferase involved in cell wall biosynthesis
MIFAIYFVLFFLIVRFTVTLFNFISNPKLRRVSKHYNDLVSILIPVRNEEETIYTLLQSIYEQDYRNYEVIVLDDSSNDNTIAVCGGFAMKDDRFKVVSGNQLPPGWLGKNYACHQAAQLAKGQYLMFIDADEKVSPALINSSIHRMKVNNLSLLSLFTNQVMKTLGENLVVPLMHYVLLNLLPIRLILLSKFPSIAAASGQFMFFDAQHYKQSNWHLQVKDKVVEDVEIMKLVKVNGLRGESLLANNLITCRMYRGFADAISGFSKNFLAAFNYSIPGFLFFILVLLGGPLLIMLTTNLSLIFFMTGLILLTRVMISLSAGQNALINVILHPLQMVSLAVLAVVAIQKQLTKGNVWKGRRV